MKVKKEKSCMSEPFSKLAKLCMTQKVMMCMAEDGKISLYQNFWEGLDIEKAIKIMEETDVDVD